MRYGEHCTAHGVETTVQACCGTALTHHHWRHGVAWLGKYEDLDADQCFAVVYLPFVVINTTVLPTLV